MENIGEFAQTSTTCLTQVIVFLTLLAFGNAAVLPVQEQFADSNGKVFSIGRQTSQYSLCISVTHFTFDVVSSTFYTVNFYFLYCQLELFWGQLFTFSKINFHFLYSQLFTF